MSEYTKGPWKAHPYNSTMGSLISYGDISKGETVAIAAVRWDRDEAISNARLIAAAPELLEALKAIGKCLAVMGVVLPLTETMLASKAIAKAEGR